MELRPNHGWDPVGPTAVTYLESGLDIKQAANVNEMTSFLKVMGDIDPSANASESIQSPDEFCQEVAARSENIFTRYETLNIILQRHEATIRKRWLKKTQKQRLKILLHAWPNMPTTRRPDFHEYRKGSPEKHGDTAQRTCFMWPYVNQEDLLTKNVLPLFMNARGRHPPSYFAAADNRAMRLGFITGTFTSTTLCQHIMILNGMTENTREYGKLMPWPGHPTILNLVKEHKQFMPGEGMLVLKAQERVLAFLIECCEQILHDIPKSDLTSETFPVLPEPQFKPESEITGFEALGAMTATAPYRVPSQLNLGLIESLLAARASAAENDLWALREDPSCFAASLLDIKDHRSETMKDTMGNDHPIQNSSHGREVLWGRIIGFTVSKAYTDNISPSKDLPLDYLEALLRFKFFVSQMAKGPLDTLPMSVLSSPPFRKFFVRQPPESETSEVVIGKKRGVELKGNGFYVFWLLRQLWEDGDFLFNASLPIVVDELNRLIQSEPEARDLMSPFIAKEVRDLSIISQCVNQLELYLPWARRFEAQLVERDEILKKAYAECTAPWAHVMTAIKEVAAKPGVVNLGEPSNGKFTYPIKKCHSRENVDVLRRSEAHLDAFWALFDELVLKSAGEVSGEALTRFLSKSRILKRTPEWVEPEKLPSKKSEQNGTSDDAEPYFSHQPASLINTGLSEKALDLPLPKTKVKTRGVSVLEENDSVDEAIPEPSLPDQPSFTVDTRAFKVFSTIFHQPARSAPVELHWIDFLHAMTSIGFSATKLDGSVWQFQPISQPVSLEVERSITFHQPHSSKIPSRVARRIGGRLSRVYGWCGETFSLAEK